jgi:hypothetical protein
VTFISIHYVIIYVVFFGACMRCTRLYSLKTGVKIGNHESCLEVGGGVNRRNLKIINLSTHYKLGLALEMNSSPRERGKQINHK